MPIYEYRRPDGTTFEMQQSFSDDPLTVDPETGVPVERVLHAPAVHFKGKGFYNTDYGTRKRQRENAAALRGERREKDSSDVGAELLQGLRTGVLRALGAPPQGSTPRSAKRRQGRQSKDAEARRRQELTALSRP